MDAKKDSGRAGFEGFYGKNRTEGDVMRNNWIFGRLFLGVFLAFFLSSYSFAEIKPLMDEKVGKTRTMEQAVSEGDIAEVRELLGKSRGKDEELRSALESAAWKGHLEIVKLFVSNGVYWRGGLLGAVKGGHLEVVRYFIELGDEVNYQHGPETPLIAAVAYGHYEVVKLLVENHADVNARSPVHGSVLQMALSRGNSEIISLLRAAGAKE